MNTLKQIRRAMVGSFVALLISIAMCIGTTFAWFTDTVQSKDNIINAGNLDISLKYSDSALGVDQQGWIDASVNPIFSSEKWEPGYTAIKYVKIQNEGSLDLEYFLKFVCQEVTGDVNLANVIEVYMQEGIADWDRSSLNADDEFYVGDFMSVMNKSEGVANGILYAKDNVDGNGKNYATIYTVALKMSELAGNEYQGVGASFSIELVATQAASESDSFDNSYDEGPILMSKNESGEWEIRTANQLIYFAQQVNSGISYQKETVKLVSDIDLDNMSWTPIGGDPNKCFQGTFDGCEHTVSNFKIEWSKYAGLFGYIKGGGNIKNLKVENAVIRANDYAGAIVGDGYTSVVNCHARNVTVIATPYWVEDGNYYDGGAKAGAVMGYLREGSTNNFIDCSAINVEIIGYRDLGGVLGMAGGSAVVNGCFAQNVTITYLVFEPYEGNKVNQNAGKILGRYDGANVDWGEEDNADFVWGILNDDD